MLMPKLPGLLPKKKDKDQPKGPANPLDDLDEHEFELLQEMAEQGVLDDGSADGSVDSMEAVETPADEAAESPEEQSAEAASGTEMHDPSTMATIAASYVEEIANYQQQASMAGNDDATNQLGILLEQATTAAQAASDAADQGDLQGAAAAAAQAEDACSQAEQIWQDSAKAMPADEAAKAPAGHTYPMGASGGIKSPLSIWLARNGQ